VIEPKFAEDRTT